jgi:transcription initiation factor TFIIIB Brf1 subunit/transcription initiation factor TFIIB
MRCSSCGSDKNYLSSNKELICKNCGLVIEDCFIDNSKYSSSSNQNKGFLPELAIAGSQQVNGRIVKSHWLLSHKEKHFIQVKRSIELVSSRLNLTDTLTTESLMIYKKSLYKEINKGRDNQSLMYASIYLACLLHNISKVPREILIGTKVSKKKLMKSYKLIKKELGIKSEPPDPLDLVPRFGSKLELTQETIMKTSEIIMQIQEQQLMAGRQPMTILATAIHIATKKTGQKVTQRNITNATGVLEATIRSRSKAIMLLTDGV